MDVNVYAIPGTGTKRTKIKDHYEKQEKLVGGVFLKFPPCFHVSSTSSNFIKIEKDK